MSIFNSSNELCILDWVKFLNKNGNKKLISSIARPINCFIRPTEFSTPLLFAMLSSTSLIILIIKSDQMTQHRYVWMKNFQNQSCLNFSDIIFYNKIFINMKNSLKFDFIGDLSQCYPSFFITKYASLISESFLLDMMQMRCCHVYVYFV